MNVLNLKDILSFKIRFRCDSWTDQWNRLIMCKIFLIIALVIGIDYFQDEITCMISENAAIDGAFVQSACWIMGFYVYPDLSNQWKHVGYHGVPKDLSMDGIDKDGSLCPTITKYGTLDPNCRPMRKEFYLQYQWYPFFVGSLALLYYIPYLVYRFANKDIISLREVIEEGKHSKESILSSHFDRHMNSKNEMRVRVAGIFLVKILYLGVNFFAFSFIDSSMNGRFVKYGLSYLRWNSLPNSVAHDLQQRHRSKPSDQLLPPMGICDIDESSRDIRNTLINRHRFICELSQNILYQYCFLIIWFLIVASIVISIYGIAQQVYYCAKGLWVLKMSQTPVYRSRDISLREHQYLEVIRDIDPLLYQDMESDLSNESNLNNGEAFNKALAPQPNGGPEPFTMKLQQLNGEPYHRMQPV
ncbi:innexin inx3-like [Clytia hemisphaerica]|uniref:Innexin n=1 Tax=Clytia hemisphaerica TaxID=252671 RepID=A0A7M5VGB3_9CNID